MARRPIFRPVLSRHRFVEEVVLDFEWHSGFARSQAQKSINSLHEAARDSGLTPVLEISSKSQTPLGVALSAFNLMLRIKGQTMSVEVAFQGSKVFEKGGPFHDLYNVSSRDAKTDERIRSSGRLIGFNLLGEDWPTEPQTCFYDWLFQRSSNIRTRRASYCRFTRVSDIAFNPEKSLNCQARSAAVFASFSRQELLTQALRGKEEYLALVGGVADAQQIPAQRDLFSELG